MSMLSKHWDERWALALAIAFVTAVGILYHWPLIATQPGADYPWGSDALGHLAKSQFLAEQWRQGNWLPVNFPDWYAGFQFMRYWPPLTYFLLSGLSFFTDGILATGNLFVVIVTIAGSLSFLLFRRFVGLVPAVAGAILFMTYPDHVRVAMAEGNLLRVLSVAVLPSVFYVILTLLLVKVSPWSFAFAAIGTSVLVLAHPMMGAIFSVCMGLTIVTVWLSWAPNAEADAPHGGNLRIPAQQAGAGLGAISVGLLLTSWWLLPSLFGGITGVDAEAQAQAFARFDALTILNPLLRDGNKEIFYLGLATVGVTALAVFAWGRLDGLTRGLFAAGIPILLLSSTLFNPIYETAPLHALMRPDRFMSFAGFILVLAAVSWAGRLWRGGRGAKLLAVGMVLALGVDALPSRGLVFARPGPEDLIAISETIAENPGWRVAAADLSKLGSQAPYFFDVVAEKEQTFGWAYQGAAMSARLSTVNFGMAEGYGAYAVHFLDEMGADYVVRLDDAAIGESFDQSLFDRGFTVIQETPRLQLYYREGGPRGLVLRGRILGIGQGAQMLQLAFPHISNGASQRVDDYSLEFLQRFPTLFLSGFSWNHKGVAEELIADYVSGGGKVIVDFTAVPVDPFSQRPEFLGAYGEPVSLYKALQVQQGTDVMRLKAFDEEYTPWIGFVPQKIDQPIATFDYLGQSAILVGTKEVGTGSVLFVGANLPFHAVITQDPVATGILEELLGIEANVFPATAHVPLTNYDAGATGYTFTYETARAEPLMVPIGHYNGTVVTVDGQEVESDALQGLVYFLAPAGTHDVTISVRRTAVHVWGFVVTLLALLGLAAPAYMGRLGGLRARLQARRLGARPLRTATEEQS
jgi:uncharacterized membrane protein